MTTQFQTLDENWVDIKASLSLLSSTEYLLQNAGSVTVFVQEAASPPAATDVGRRLLANTSLPIFVSTDNFYVRTEKLGSQLIVDLGVESGVPLAPVCAGLFASQYDGTNDYQIREADLTGNVDGKKHLISFFVRLEGVDIGQPFFIFGPIEGNGFLVVRASSNQHMLINASNSSPTFILVSSSDPTIVEVDGEWRHILMSGDLASPGSVKIYIDDVETTTVFIATDDIIDYTQPDHGIGAQPNGSSKLNGSLSELYINLAENLDLTVESNRRSFISADLKPVFLGANGEFPTGTPPIVFAPNGDATQNLGTGGNYTTMGSLNSVAGPGV